MKHITEEEFNEVLTEVFKKEQATQVFYNRKLREDAIFSISSGLSPLGENKE